MLERSCVEVAGSDEDLTLHEWLIGWGAILLFLTLVVWASYWILLFLTWLLGNALPWMFWGGVTLMAIGLLIWLGIDVFHFLQFVVRAVSTGLSRLILFIGRALRRG